MPRLTVSMFEGRSVDQKRALAKKLTEVVCEICECSPEAVTISFEDTKKENSARAGILQIDR